MSVAPPIERRLERPRVLVLTPDYPPSSGGIQLLLSRIVENLRHSDARVVTRGGRSVRSNGDPRVTRVGRGRLGLATLNAWALPEAIRFRPDVVLGGHVVTGPSATLIGRLLGTPVVQYLHADEVLMKGGVARFALSHADAVVTVSDYTRRMAVDYGASPGAVRVIPPGVDRPADRSGAKSDQPTVVTIARLKDRYKGHDVMVRALPHVAARVPGVRWVVVGEGPLRGELEAAVAGAGLSDRVIFTGAVPDAERDAWLDRAHVFAMPSRLPDEGVGGEGFGIAFMEASARGLPVVAGNVAGAPDAVVHGETGLLVNPTDPMAVADALCRLLIDRELSDRLGRAGVARARRFEWPLVVARVEEFLLETAAGGRRQREVSA